MAKGMCPSPLETGTQTDWEGFIRFANADFVLARSLQAYATHPYILVTYDIACQYLKYIVQRFQVHSPQLVDAVTLSRYAVPIFHVQGHKDDCQYRFAPPYMEGTGCFKGETIETTWSETNKLGASTREMAAGNRHDHINDHIGDINWRKARRMGTCFLSHHSVFFSHVYAVMSLSKQLRTAVDQAADKRTFFEGCSAVYCDHVAEWSNVSTEPTLVNGEWESVYRRKRQKRTCHP